MLGIKVTKSVLTSTLNCRFFSFGTVDVIRSRPCYYTFLTSLVRLHPRRYYTNYQLRHGTCVTLNYPRDNPKRIQSCNSNSRYIFLSVINKTPLIPELSADAMNMRHSVTMPNLAENPGLSPQRSPQMPYEYGQQFGNYALQDDNERQTGEDVASSRLMADH